MKITIDNNQKQLYYQITTIKEVIFIKFIKYRQNLSHDDFFVYSYNTKVAEIDIENKTLWKLGYWSSTTSKHINYAAKELNLRVETPEWL